MSASTWFEFLEAVNTRMGLARRQEGIDAHNRWVRRTGMNAVKPDVSRSAFVAAAWGQHVKACKDARAVREASK